MSPIDADGRTLVELTVSFRAVPEIQQAVTELRRLSDMAAFAAKNGIEPHAGHGLTYDNVQPVAAIPQVAELNIGHYLIGEAIFTGLEASVRRMRDPTPTEHAVSVGHEPVGDSERLEVHLVAR